MHRVFTNVALFCGALVVSLAPRIATAQDCDTNHPCDKGFICQEGVGACPAIACAPDADCPPCDPKTFSSCVLAPCDPNGPDDQCGDDKVCHTETYDNCTTPACPPNEACPDVKAESSCTPQTQSTCTYKASLPCKTADDCGDGYDCVVQQVCGCSGGSEGVPTPAGESGSGDSSSGSGGSSSSDPAAPSGGADSNAPNIPSTDPTLPPDSSCGCTDTDLKWCQPKQIVCSDEVPCPLHWSCEAEATTGVACSGPAMDGGAGNAGGAPSAGSSPANSGTAGSNAAADCPPPPPATDTKVCFPPYYGGPSYSQGTTNAPTEAPGGGVASSDDRGETQGQQGPLHDLPALGNPPPSANSGSSEDVATTPTSPKASMTSGDKGGCSISSSVASGSAASLAWLALAFVALARRRQS